MQEMSQTDLKEIQAVTLTMSKYFVQFCQENNLLCYFCGGGCIGAVRSQGFIPW
ncbi:TPA: LicD family protein, partial [Enterococcus faecalis]|nr:LicD family protein [Enterococcus faecalis]